MFSPVFISDYVVNETYRTNNEAREEMPHVKVFSESLCGSDVVRSLCYRRTTTRTSRREPVVSRLIQIFRFVRVAQMFVESSDVCLGLLTQIGCGFRVTTGWMS